MIEIFNEDCFQSMKRFSEEGKHIDVVMTSPPYNTGRPTTTEHGRDTNQGRYDSHMDNMSQEDYCQWCVDIFNELDEVLSENGTILWNVSYGSDATVTTEGIGLMWLCIADIIRNTPFTVADRIIWKKSSALPNNTSPNKLTRIVEDVFVFCRKSEYKSFSMNKEVSKTGKTGQTYYKNYFNFVEAKNNDGVCKLNKATYSSELCEKLLSMYAKNGSVVYDPFMGTGTTAVACVNLGLDCYGSEISENQCEYARNRIEEAKSQWLMNLLKEGD